MSGNELKVTAIDVEAFVAAIADPVKRADTETLMALLHTLGVGPPTLWGEHTIGYGHNHDRSFFLLGLCVRRREWVIFLPALNAATEAALARLGKYKIDSTRLYIKRLSDIDTAALAQVLRAALDANHV